MGNDLIKPQKNIKVNSLYSIGKSACAIVFPLILYKYATNVLNVDMIGSVDYIKSIANYFILLAGLGIETFAIQRGGALKEDKEKFNDFASRVFSIHLVSSLFSILLLLLFSFFLIETNYQCLCFIFCFELPLILFGFDWIFYIYEEFQFLFFKTLLSGILSLILAFIFVKAEDDVIPYSLSLVIGTYGFNLLSLFKIKKRARLRILFDNISVTYFLPIAMLFLNQIATTVYVNSDITILGFLQDDYCVGLYSSATKLYTGVKSFFNAIFIVFLTRLSAVVTFEDKKAYLQVLNKVRGFLSFSLLPIVVGLIFAGKELLILISSEKYIDAYSSLVILAFSLFFSTYAMFFSSCCLLPNKKEREVMVSTLLGAATNVLLNFALIPYLGIIAAALTTLLSEIIVSIFMLFVSLKKRYFSFSKKQFINYCKSLIGCVFIVAICCFIHFLNLNIWACLIFEFLGSILIYGIIELMLRHEFVNNLLFNLKGRIKKRK